MKRNNDAMMRTKNKVERRMSLSGFMSWVGVFYVIDDDIKLLSLPGDGAVGSDKSD